MQNLCIDSKYSVFICVCAHDTVEGFSAAYESVANQTLPPSQTVICADNLSGALLEAVEKLRGVADVLHVDSKGDHATVRAAALEACKYEYVAVMDADDVALDGRVARLLEMMKYADVAGGAIREFSKQSGEFLQVRRLPQTDDEIKKYMKKRCPFNHMTVMYKKSSVMRCGGYLPLFCNEDYYLWVRMAKAGYVFANTDEILCYAGISEASYERRGGRAYFESEKTLQKYMLQNGIISKGEYFVNVAVRFAVEILMTAKMRKLFYRIFLRKKQ